MGITAGLNQGYSQSQNSYGGTQGSVNSAQSYNNSFNESWSQSASGTNAAAAREWSAMMADLAWERDMEAYQMQMDYNSKEAKKQRDWEAKMANTIYTRSVKNMREAGINPILAYRMGLSGANVGSGATASLGGSPSAPLAQNFMDSWSSSSSYSHGSGYGESESNGNSWGNNWGNGWSNSEYGIVDALEGIGNMVDAAIDNISSGSVLENLDKMYKENNVFGKLGEDIGEKIKNSTKKAINYIKEYNNGGKSGGGHGF